MSHFREYKCKNCGSELNFDADAGCLKCLHCANQIEIFTDIPLACEENISLFKNIAENFEAKTPHVHNLNCTKCGSTIELSENIAFVECYNCKANLVNLNAYKFQEIQPTGIVPFQISKAKAIQIFQNWIVEGIWYDADLKKVSIINNLSAHYVPFWSFNAQTDSVWTGYSGKYVKKKLDKSELHNMDVVWKLKIGTYSHNFKNLLICASTHFLGKINHLGPYNLDNLKPFNFDYIVGWDSSAFDRDMNESFEEFKKNMNQYIQTKCEAKLKDDTFKDLAIQTFYSNETFYLILVPIWECNYFYKGKLYNFVINGQSGEIQGTKPISKSCLLFLIIIFLLLFGLFLLILL